MMQSVENLLSRTGDPRDKVYAGIIAGVRRAREKDVYPSFVTSAETRVIVQTPFETPIVSESVYKQIREALARKGFTFVVDINPVSIGQLAINEKTRSLFAFIDRSEKMRLNVPPQIQVAIDPDNVRIKGSDRRSTDGQIRMIKKREAVLKSKLPEEVRNLFSMIMPKHASILAQLDFEYQKRTGRVLFPDWHGRTDDQTVPGRVAGVGRIFLSDRLRVYGEWARDFGNPLTFAVPVVVLPRRLTVDFLSILS